jgi:sugar lactone lactonase YvrE
MRIVQARRRSLVAVGLAALGGAAHPSIAAAHEGWGIVLDRQGRVHVADIPQNTIWRIERDGRRTAVARRIHSHALSIDADGYVYGTHVHFTRPERSVWRLDPTGRVSAVVTATEGTLLSLQSALLAPDGTLYSASPYQHPAPAGGRALYLLRRSPAGAVDTVAGGLVGHADGAGRHARFQAIDGMAWLPDGAIVIADGPWLRRVTTGGAVATLGAPVTTPRWGEDLLGVAVGADGAIYAADFAGRTLWRVAGERRTVVRGPGRFWSPAGVTVTPTGELYVLEHPRAPFGLLGDLGIGPYLTVRHRSADGRWTVLATCWGPQTALVAAVCLAICAAGALGAARRRRRRDRRARRVPDGGPSPSGRDGPPVPAG